MFDAPTEVDAPEREPPYELEPTRIARSQAEVDALVALGMDHVEHVARSILLRVRSLADKQELCAVGRVALVEAARDYDPARGDAVIFLRMRLRWAMLDSVRRETHGRSAERRAKALRVAERVVEAMLSEAPDPAVPESGHARQLRRVLGGSAAAMMAALSAAQEKRATARPSSPSARETETTSTPEEEVERASASRAIADAMSELPPKQRAIVERHYFEEERFDEIAESLGISKSWASRLHAQAMVQLGERLRDLKR